MIYANEPHSPAKRFKENVKFPWLVCRKCGLIYLNNAITKWAIQKGCNHEDHPDWPSWRNRSQQ